MSKPKHSFHQVEATLAYHVVLEDGFLEFAQICGVDFSEFKTYGDIVAKYRALRESNGRDYAVWELRKAVSDLEHAVHSDFPREQSSFRAWYEGPLREVRVQRLITELTTDPESAEDIMRRFMLKQAGGVSIKTVQQMADEWQEAFIKRREGGAIAFKLPGFELTSSLIGGFNTGRLTQIMAMSGFGKTTLGVQLAIAAAKTVPTIYVNMEMIPYDMIERVLVAASGIGYADLYRDGEHLASQAMFAIADCNLRITDGSELTLGQIESVIRLEKATNGLQFVVIDYDQKMVLRTSREVPEWQALHRATVILEGLAKSLDLQIIVLAQTNQEGEMSGSRRSMFPASAVLRFYEAEDKRVMLEAVKNRFGRRGGAVWCVYDPAKALVKEHEFVESVPTEKNRKRFDDV